MYSRATHDASINSTAVGYVFIDTWFAHGMGSCYPASVSSKHPQHRGIRDRLRFVRQGRHLTCNVLAQRAGITHTTVAQIESGRTIPGVDTVEKLADALGVDPRWFTFGTPEPEQHPFQALIAPDFHPIQLVAELRTLLGGRSGHIDDTYKYLDPIGAAQFQQLHQQQDFADEVFTVPIREIASAITPLLGDGPCDLLGLGVGTGDHEIKLATKLAKLPDLRLLLLDVSLPLLAEAAQNAIKHIPRSRNIPVIGILGNFHQLPSYSFLEADGPRKYLVTMFGYTFGNLENEVRFVSNSLSWLSPGDLLLLDVDCAIAPASDPALIRKRDRALSTGSPPSWLSQVEEFLTGPIQRYGTGIRSVVVNRTLDLHSSPVPGSYAIDMRAVVESTAGKKEFSVGYTKRYDLDGLTECMKKLQWQFIHHWPYADNRSMVCLFERRASPTDKKTAAQRGSRKV